MTMPSEIEIHLQNITNLQECYQTVKDLLTIVQSNNEIQNKLSTLSLIQSRSPSPTPRSRTPSPRFNRQPIVKNVSRQSRPTQRSNRNHFNGFRQYPGLNNPRPILQRNNFSAGRGRGNNMPFPRPRSLSQNRNRGNVPRCYFCNIPGHLARNCFCRNNQQTRYVPRQRYTPNFPPRRGRRQSRPLP